MKTNIVVNLTVEGLHFWKTCSIKEVDFLKNTHRHLFYITCKKEVAHDDRDIEIIMFKRRIKEFLKENYYGDGIILKFGSMSCEMIAKELVQEFNLTYCLVLEDNENGAEVINI